MNQRGGSNPPRPDHGWALEISLDVQIAHAICPKCHVLLFESDTNYLSDLSIAENYAAAHANVVSNSYGASEFSGETGYDSAYNHLGVPITVSSGDSGYGVEWPAASPYVTAVGGTTLTLNANKTRASETAWSGSGSGCSSVEPKPSWQAFLAGCTQRVVADVSADADPNTGAAVYDSYGYYGQRGWFQVGGTSPLHAADRQRLRARRQRQLDDVRVLPVLAHLLALRRNAGQQRQTLHPELPLHRRDGIRRPHRARHPERHRRLLAAGTSFAATKARPRGLRRSASA